MGPELYSLLFQPEDTIIGGPCEKQQGCCEKKEVRYPYADGGGKSPILAKISDAH